MYLLHKVGFFPFLLNLLHSLLGKWIVLIISFLLLFGLEYPAKKRLQGLRARKIVLDFFVKRGEAINLPNNFDIFEHRRGDNIVKPDISLQYSHAIVEISTRNHILIQQTEKSLPE